MPLRGIEWISRHSAMKLDHFYFEDDFVGDSETISNTLTLNKSGVALLIQPSTDPGSGNVFEVKNAAGADKCVINYLYKMVCYEDIYLRGNIYGYKTVYVSYDTAGSYLYVGRSTKFGGGVALYGGGTSLTTHYLTLVLATPYWAASADWARDFIKINAPDSHTGKFIKFQKATDDVGGSPADKFVVDNDGKISTVDNICLPFQEIHMDCLAASANHIVANEALNVGTPINCTEAAQPDVPRNVIITITDGDVSISAFQITVAGKDAKGDNITEVFLFAGGLVQTGSKAFINGVTVTVDSITGAGAGDVLDVGIEDLIGLCRKVKASGDVYKVKKNNADMTVPSINTTYDTVDLTNITGGDDYTIWYKPS